MRPIAQWTETDLQGLIDNRTSEGREIDFKDSRIFSRDGFKADLGKDCAAFANAAGGMIVIGIIEDDKVAVGVDDGVSAGVMTAERLSDIIQGQVEPKIEGLETASVALESGGFAFVVRVPAATAYAPHQAGDKRYHRRVDARNQQMADHEVRDLMRRGTTPRPVINFILEEQTPSTGDRLLGNLVATITNEASEPMMYGLIKLIIDSRLITPDFKPNPWTMDRDTIRTAERAFDADVLRKTHSIPSSMPIWNGVAFSLINIPVNLTDLNDYFALAWEVSCPGAVTKGQQLWASSHGRTHRLD